MRSGIHQAELTIDPEDLAGALIEADGRGMGIDFGLAQHDTLYDPDIPPFVPTRRYAVRILGPDACSFAADDNGSSGAIVRPLKRMTLLSNIQAGERLRLRADLTQGELGCIATTVGVV